MLRSIPALLVVLSCIVGIRADHLYKTMLVRAAPGKLLDLIELYRTHMPVYEASGDEQPMIMRQEFRRLLPGRAGGKKGCSSPFGRNDSGRVRGEVLQERRMA